MITRLEEIAAHLGCEPHPTRLSIERGKALVPQVEITWDTERALVRVRTPVRLAALDFSSTPEALARAVAEVNRTLEVVGLELDGELLFVTHAFLDDDGIAPETIDRLMQAVDECELRITQVFAP